MQFTIDGNTIDFQLKKGNAILAIEGKRKRGEFNDEYTSENLRLLAFKKQSPQYNIKLVNIFDSITDFENELHKVYYYCKIIPGSHDFVFTADNVTLVETITGVLKDDIKIDYIKNNNKIKAEITLKILTTYE